MFLASKHACDPVCVKTTTLPTTIPAKHPPGNEDGGSHPHRSCLFPTPSLDVEGLGVMPRHESLQDEGPMSGKAASRATDAFWNDSFQNKEIKAAF